MHRSNLLQKLATYHPAAPEEIDYKQRMIDFIQQHPECFERTLAIGHITASTWLLNKDGSKALLMHHTKLNRWVQLGGHCDGDWNALNVAIKEAQEESGIEDIASVHEDIFDIDIHLIPDNPREKAHYHYDVRFLLQVTGDENVVQNRESKELRWIPADATMLPTHDLSVVRMFDKWLARK